MDLSKYHVDKLFHFAAGIIPGFTALLIFEAANPGSLSWFLSLGALGYKTKLALVILASFVVGNTMTTLLSAILGGIGYSIGFKRGQQEYKPAHTFEVAPWRDRLWRIALKNVMGSDTPDDTLLITEGMFEQQQRMIEDFQSSQTLLPQFQLPLDPLLELKSNKLSSEINDGKWQEWYNHFHRVVLEKHNRDFVFHIRTGLYFNMETTGLYILLSALMVPSVRHWWCIVPACAWVLLLISESYYGIHRYSNMWSTLFDQIDYLNETRLQKSKEGLVRTSADTSP